MNKIIKILLTSFISLNIGLGTFAANIDEAQQFFKRYIGAANTYSNEVPNFYSSNATIIRQVIKPDGTLVDVPFTMEQYKSQMKISSKIAKMKNYKNHYSNLKVTEIDNNTYQIDAYRQPSTGGDKLKTSMTVQKKSNGNWVIIKEVMQTKEQIFLKYAK